MNNTLTRSTFAALSLVAIALIAGCTQQTAGNAPAYVTTSTAAPTPPAQTATAPAIADAPVVPPAAEIPAQTVVQSVPASAVSESVVMPEKLRISQPLNEVIRLAQSGVDESVILTYITNSPAIFTLGAEEIVYLNDLGISSSVITAMMQRDQALKAAYAASGQAVAVAPSYVNTPQPQAVAVQETQPVQVTQNYFYDSLSPYGQWIEVEDYGRVWRPTVAVSAPSWRPYVDRGRWVHSDAGWYWMSDYSWGSIAFHYGRWFSHPRWGWCWWPDTVWAPSWVSWRYDNDHCGWAPLPPLSYYRPGAGFYYRNRNVGFSFDFGIGADYYTFVQWGRFHDARPYRYCLPRDRATVVYNNTTVINNYGDGNNVVINRGISKDRVRERSRVEVKTVNIREERITKNEVRPARLERDGRTIIVPRPTLAAVGNPAAAVEKNSSRVNSAPAPISTQPRDPVARGTDRGDRREQGREIRSVERDATAPAMANRPAAAAPTITNPVAEDKSNGRNERGQRTESKSEINGRSGVPVRTQPATPVQNATPIFSRPVVVETVPQQTPARTVVTPQQNNIKVIGDGRNGSGNRGYSVWTPPVQPAATPQPDRPASAPQFNRPTAPTPAVQPETPRVVSPAPVENRSWNNPRREDKVERAVRPDSIERQSRARSEERVSVPVISAPAPVQAPSPQVSRPAAPSYTPQPAQRVESRPAPSRPEPSRSESRSESKGESNRGKRDN